ncbi:hypothetical protein Dsin_029151 [Dipteronia sinensis]|uniref:Uncharacterized protein n=1 Tax=Dipteronia sinensis TaxID=43782 RepID=A0AAD9ZSK4_9ROSI|nr:hypothetical protein Dsin_029151 [Dipteronia sinensis]
MSSRVTASSDCNISTKIQVADPPQTRLLVYSASSTSQTQVTETVQKILPSQTATSNQQNRTVTSDYEFHLVDPTCRNTPEETATLNCKFTPAEIRRPPDLGVSTRRITSHKLPRSHRHQNLGANDLLINHPLHATAYYLNPKYQYRDNIGDNLDLLIAVYIVYTQLDPEAAGIANFGNEGNLDPLIASHARDMGINVEQMIREEVGVDCGVTVSSSSVDQHTSDGNSGGQDDGDDGDEGRGLDSSARGWDAGATSWDVRARGWDASATCWTASAIIAKALANRFCMVLREVISDSQSAFIPGRPISDNAIVGYECLYSLKRKKRKDVSMAIKLDMSKA